MRRRASGVPFLAFLLVLAAVLASADPAGAAGTVNWPQFRFNQNHTGVNPSESTISAANIQYVTLDWAAQLGTLVDFSSPAIVNGVAYIGSDDGRLWAYPADGCGQALCTTPLWSSTSLAQIIDSPAVKNGIVYVGSQTSFTSAAGKLNAFSAAGCGQAVCSPLWQGLAGSQSILQSSPAVGNGFVFVGAYDRRLYAFPAKGCGAPTCQPAWRGTTGGHIESSPTVVGGVVYVGSDDGNLYAYDANGCGGALSCPPLWTGPIGGPAFESTPAVVGGVVYISSDHYLAAFNATGCGAATCPPLWQGTYQGEFFGGSPAVFGGRVYVGLEDGLGVFSAGGCGQAVCGPLWLDFGSGFQAQVESAPAVANGLVYAGRNTGEVLAWRTGPCGSFQCTNVWSGATGDPLVNSSPAVVNGRIYIGSADDNFPEDIQGRLYVFDLST